MSLSEHAVLFDPAAVSSPHRPLREPTVAFQVSELSACGFSVTRLNRFTSVTACSSLCLRLTQFVAEQESKARFSVGRLVPLAEAGISPAERVAFRLTHRMYMWIARISWSFRSSNFGIPKDKSAPP